MYNTHSIQLPQLSGSCQTHTFIRRAFNLKSKFIWFPKPYQNGANWIYRPVHLILSFCECQLHRRKWGFNLRSKQKFSSWSSFESNSNETFVFQSILINDDNDDDRSMHLVRGNIFQIKAFKMTNRMVYLIRSISNWKYNLKLCLFQLISITIKCV